MDVVLKKTADIVFPIAHDVPFKYLFPEGIIPPIPSGQRVIATLGKRSMIGYYVGLGETADDMRLKPFERFIDSEPLIGKDMLGLAKWMSNYYCCSLGEAMATVISPSFRAVPHEVHEMHQKKHIYSPFIPTPRQNEVLSEILDVFTEGRYAQFLIHGVTDSGKTEVYMESIASALYRKKQVLFLIPEISLSNQIGAFLNGRFGAEVGLWHSRISKKERLRVWELVRSARLKIVLGTRSALFLPFKDLGLIIIDDEHDNSYKQESKPMYRAQDVAKKRAESERAVLLMGSATPSLETYYYSKKGMIRMLSMKDRIMSRPAPKMRLVDMRREFGKSISECLKQAIDARLRAKEQCIILINRKGSYRNTFCHNCGMIYKCSRCDVSMVYYSRENRLVCHYCGNKIKVPHECPSCKSGNLGRYGVGSERVETELKAAWPSARIFRLDMETARDGNRSARIIDAFRKRKADILVGTQLLAKGWDFPWVTLVGIISADMYLSMPDFRSGEKTYSLLVQAAGRSGRGRSQGEVIVQTYNPDHPVLRAAVSQDYESFYSEEVELRRMLKYPPFSHIINLIIKGKREKSVQSGAEYLASILRKKLLSAQVLGPSPALRSKLAGLYRWQMIIKAEDPYPVLDVLKQIQEQKIYSGTKLMIDVDPVDLI